MTPSPAYNPRSRETWRRSTEPRQNHHIAIRITKVLVIQTLEFIILGSSDVASRDPVDDEEQDDGDDKRPCSTECCSSKLISHLLPVPGPPSAFVRVAHAVHGGDVGCREEAGEDVADVATDAVDGEDIKTLVDMEEVFVFDSEEGSTRGKGSDECRGLNGHISARRRDTNEASNDTGAKSNNREFPRKDIFQQHPSHAATTGRKIGVADNVHGPN